MGSEGIEFDLAKLRYATNFFGLCVHPGTEIFGIGGDALILGHFHTNVGTCATANKMMVAEYPHLDHKNDGGIDPGFVTHLDRRRHLFADEGAKNRIVGWSLFGLVYVCLGGVNCGRPTQSSTGLVL